MKLSREIQNAERVARENDDYWSELLKIEFSLALEQQRKRAGLSYAEIANRIKSSAAYITKVFRGETNLTIESMVKLSRAVDGHVSIDIVDKTVASHKWDVAYFTKGNRTRLTTVAANTTVLNAVNDHEAYPFAA